LDPSKIINIASDETVRTDGGDKMTVFLVETYVIKPDKLEEFNTLLKKSETYMKKHPDLFKEMKSHKIFSQLFGGNWGGYIEMYEFENLASFEKWMTRIMQSDYMKTSYPEQMSLVVPGTHSANMWNSVP
jgi:antibiotic biosynthesis monooxygenase (ABM) superfamily enzyme